SNILVCCLSFSCFYAATARRLKQNSVAESIKALLLWKGTISSDSEKKCEK
ncbi:hypothetical protein STEG23_017843, partial [Scotinomys teguina]